MSIKIPDMQVLIARSEQIPKILKEGDPTTAGKLAPEIVKQYIKKPKKVADSPKSSRPKNKKNNQNKNNQKSSKGNSLDIRV